MKPSVLVSGVGAVIGQGIIKSLRGSGVPLRLIGIDANPSSVGFHWTDASYTVPRTDDPLWADTIITICNKEKINLILPGIEQDIKALLRNRDRMLKHTEAFTLLNSPEAYRVGFDKWELYCFASENNVNMPRTWLLSDAGHAMIPDTYPVLLKPREGMAGKGIYRVENRDSLKHCTRGVQAAQYIIQRHVGDSDNEYTVSVFGYSDGTLSDAFILKRKLNYGSTFEAETVHDPALSQEVHRIARALNIIGPTNLQFRKAEGTYYLLEINPRFSSSTSIKSAFGFNEPLMAVKNILFRETRINLKLKRGACSRYLEDLVTFT